MGVDMPWFSGISGISSPDSKAFSSPPHDILLAGLLNECVEKGMPGPGFNSHGSVVESPREEKKIILMLLPLLQINLT
jgi:hypothetical protein